MPERLPRVTRVEVIGAHRLRLGFDDGVEGEIDASGWSWHGVFKPLEDPDYFARVELDLGSIEWPNGVGIAPETLYDEVTGGTRLVG